MHFPGALTKLRKATANFLMSLSVRLERLGSYWTDFHETSYLSAVQKSAQKNQISLKYYTRIMGTSHEDQ
jgi:hypothetical protein